MKQNTKNKTGYIYYDKKDKRFRCIYFIFEPNTSMEKRKSKSFLNQEDAEKFLSTIECQRGNSLYLKYNGIPLIELMKSIVQRKLDMNLIRERQYMRTMDTIHSIEKSYLGNKKIDDITSEEIQNYLNSLTHYSQSTIRKVYDQLSQSFKFALNKGFILKNPLVDVIKPKSKKNVKVVRALELEEQQILTDYLINIPIEQEPLKNVFLLQMYLGLRIGETLALKTTDINLLKNIISVNKTLTLNKAGNLIIGDTTKTYAGIREIPIPEFIRNEIINQMRLAENNKDKQLFLSSNNNYVNPRNANRALKKIFQALNIENSMSTHNLRHTYGTRCIEAGMRAVALQRLMGHNNITVTLNTYTSIFNKYKEQELEKVNNYYLNNNLFSNNDILPASSKKEENSFYSTDLER